jgi:hypothetical protein
MEFENEVHEETFNRLQEYLGELFEEPYHDPDNDHFYVRYGTTVLEISVQPYGISATVTFDIDRMAGSRSSTAPTTRQVEVISGGAKWSATAWSKKARIEAQKFPGS